jgi:hypothetical protein
MSEDRLQTTLCVSKFNEKVKIKIDLLVYWSNFTKRKSNTSKINAFYGTL